MARTATPLGIGQSTPVPFNPVAAQKTQVLAVSPFSLHLLKGVKGGFVFHVVMLQPMIDPLSPQSPGPRPRPREAASA